MSTATAKLLGKSSEQLQPAFDSTGFLKNVFDKLDANGDGRISREELKDAFDSLLDCSDLKSKKSLRTLLAEAGINKDFYVFEQLDTDHDGKITWEEFESNLRAAPVEPATAKPADTEPATANIELDATEEREVPFIVEADGASKPTKCCF